MEGKKYEALLQSIEPQIDRMATYYLERIRIQHPEMDAEDVAQEFRFVIWNKRFDWDQKCKWQTFAIGVIKSKVQQMCRKTKKRNGINLEVHLEAPLTNDENFCLTDTLTGTEDFIDYKIAEIDLERTITSFSDEQKMIIKGFLLGVPQVKMAKKMNMTQSHISKILSQLKEQIYSSVTSS